jgi:site-specific recombinase XerD
VDSTPRAYRLKASNAAPPISTLIGTLPIVTQISGRTFNAVTIDEMADWLLPACRSLDDPSAPGEGRARFQRTLTALRQFCNLLHLRFGIACDHILLWKQPRSRSSRSKFVPSATDWNATVGYLSTLEGWNRRRDAAALRLVSCALLSLPEIVALDAGDVDQAGMRILVRRRRSGKEVWATISDSGFWKDLEDYRRMCPCNIPPDGPLFVHFDGSRLPSFVLQFTLKAARRHLGLDDSMNAASIRVSHAVELRRNGMTDKEMLSLTGWGSSLHLAEHVRTAPVDGRVLHLVLERARANLLPTGAYRCFSPDDQRDESAAITSNQQQAIQICSAGRSRGLFADPDIEEFLIEPANRNYASWVRDLENYLTTIGKTARAATPEILDGYLRRREGEGLKVNTVICLAAGVAALYRSMFKKGAISSNPMLHVRRPKSQKPPSEAASPEVIRLHIAAIEEAIEHDLRPVGLYLRGACLVALSALEGWSPAEIQAARVDYIEQRLGADTMAAAYTQLAMQRFVAASEAREFLFQGYSATMPMTRQHIGHTLRLVQQRLGLPRVSLRHLANTFRSQFLAVHPDVHLLAAASASNVGDLGYEYSEISGRAPEAGLGQFVLDFEH